MKRNIILIGFMGCGKTSVGSRLSRRLHRPMTDTDQMIEEISKMTVSEIFDRMGEEGFRRMETQCLKRLLEETEAQIISVGGGLPVREENRCLLGQLGIVIYLRVTPMTVCRRLASDTSRPLLQGENSEERVQTLMAQRRDIYEAVSDIIIDADDKEFDEIIDEIINRTGERMGINNEIAGD